MTLIILDTETAGYRGDADRVCELALLENEQKTWQAHTELINPEVEMHSEVIAVHHITNEMVKKAHPLVESTTFKRLQELNKPENILVIQNAPFDLGVLSNYGFSWKGKVIDTLVCAKHLLDTPKHALQYLRYELGLYKHEASLSQAIDIEIQAHRAMSDVLVTKLLLEHLLEYVGRLPEALVVLSNKPSLLNTIGFGKYKGQNYQQMVQEDPSYFEWCLKEFTRLSHDARQTIEHWLAYKDVA